MLKKVEAFGGKVAQVLQTNKWNQQTAFILDPDGHLFEIVWVVTAEQNNP